MASYDIHGFALEGFESVRNLFEENFRKGLEREAQLCVYVGDSRVLDLWGSMEKSSEYDGDSLAPVFSSGKSLTSICMALLVEKNLINYSDKVVAHWPEFCSGDQEKGALTIADILRHEGGIPYFNESLTFEDLLPENIKQNSIGKIIEKESLNFPPLTSNTTRQYHSLTRGHILNEIFRRADPNGRTVGECLRNDISMVLNADAYIGLSEEQFPKTVVISGLSPWRVMIDSLKPALFGRRVVPSFIDLIELFRMFKNTKRQVPYLKEWENTRKIQAEFFASFSRPEMKRGETPSCNAFCSARGLAKIASMMANKGIFDGVRIFSEDTWNSFHSNFEIKKLFGIDMITQFSQGGVNSFSSENEDRTKFSGLRDGYIGWYGLGGSVFQWYPEHQIGFSYVPTLLAWEDIRNTKGALLQKEVVDCVKRLSG